ncbi:Cytoplasmic tRNA 2-thiolation protein 2 [Fukomys damarensis]|uniref:Cytoplasmic tRNA 2-thiolation protein 2 n=1 Tax=Fukomys damarensis TaxID=885580 RepID=A0A091DN11_FUKDA|nr:Cytoplasmic tRNA 2-thiolation protein 2 [Fukomys damarensis]
MCQVGEDYVEPPSCEPPSAPSPGRGQKCVKCKVGEPVVVIRAGDAFCRDCFKAFYVHKFRAMLGKNRLIFPGEKGLSQDSAKRLRFVPAVIYVDEGAACGQSPEDRAKTLTEVKQVLHIVNFPWHIVALEEVFSLPPSVLRCCPQEPAGTEDAYKAAVDSFLQQHLVLGAEGEEEQPWPQSQDPHSPPSLARSPSAAHTEALCRLFESVRTLTAKEELLQTLRSHLILHVARAHGYSKVMTGDSCTRLAIKLMTNLALGRGAFLAWDTNLSKEPHPQGFSDERHGDVVVVRPMRDYMLKEVAFYNRLFAVPSVFTPAVDTKVGLWSEAHRTGEKLVKAPREGCAGGPLGPRCLLCMCTLDIDTADSATAFGAQTSNLSQMLPSTLQAEAGMPTAPCCAVGENPSCCWKACRREDTTQAQVTQQLCYGCRGNMRDLPSLDPLPPYILAEAQLRSQRAQVMQEIQEYLIEDSGDEVETATAQS